MSKRTKSVPGGTSLGRPKWIASRRSRALADRGATYTRIVTKGLEVQPTEKHHLVEIYDLYRRYLAREPNEARIALYVSEFPSAVLTDASRVVGFVFTTDFAPDILELANILIDSDYRNQGSGERLIRYVEENAAPKFRAIILVNSVLYPSIGVKRLATTFYKRLGYEIIAATKDTNIFYREIGHSGQSLDSHR
jgi:GNAT superfamily N-acetyltransferase